MKTRFVGQPFDDFPNLVDFINHARDDRFDELKIAVAWAKQSGLGRVFDALEEFRRAGGKVTLIVGVSEGGATKEGLKLALDIADEAYVFHDPRRTFHPKVYYASSSGARSLMVGSSNLTAGGLSWNYEASLWIDWDAVEGVDVTDSVESWFAALLDEGDSCSPLTDDLIKDLEASRDIFIGSEDRSRRVPQKKLETPEDNDSSIAATINGLFKAVRAGLRSLPPLSPRFTSKTGANGAAKTTANPKLQVPVPTSVQQPARNGAAPFPLSDVQRRWFKKMDHTAAQQPKGKHSNPTGNLRLSQEDADINHKIYFRNDFFAGLPWSPTPNKTTEQEVQVTFHTWIDGQDLGPVEIRISHDPNRISGQGNVPTVLHWGPLGRILRGINYIDFFVNLEITNVGEYRLIISEGPRDDYVA